MNIDDLIQDYFHRKDRVYFNKNTYDVLEKSKYLNLSEKEKQSWVLMPKFSHSQQEKWAKEFLKTLSIPYKIIVEQIENVYMRKFKMNFMDGFHHFCEDNKLWENFIYFQEAEEVNTMIKWCKKNNIPYDTESKEEKYVKHLLERINYNDKKLEFNEKYEYSSDYMDKFELFCKQNGIWETILKIHREEQEKYLKEICKEYDNKDKDKTID